MDDFKAIYKILKTLHAAMDCSEFDPEQISAERVGLSEERWKRCMEILVDEGFVKGAIIEKDMAGMDVEFGDVTITLAGLEYLHNNSIMKKVHNAAKGVVEIIPGVKL